MNGEDNDGRKTKIEIWKVTIITILKCALLALLNYLLASLTFQLETLQHFNLLLLFLFPSAVIQAVSSTGQLSVQTLTSLPKHRKEFDSYCSVYCRTDLEASPQHSDTKLVQQPPPLCSFCTSSPLESSSFSQ